MRPAPFEAIIRTEHGETRLEFASQPDAAAGVLAQARLHEHALRFEAQINHRVGDTSTVVDYAVGHQGLIEETVAAGLDSNDGLFEQSVYGIAGKVYAHRSTTIDGALTVGIDAEEGQRILVVINDGDMLDTTVGANAGHAQIETGIPGDEQQANGNAHMGLIHGESLPAGGLAVSTRFSYLLPDEVRAAGADAVQRWLAATVQAIAAAHPVRIVVQVGDNEPARTVD